MNRTDATPGDAGNTPKLIAAWVFVGVPLLWGVLDTLRNAVKLFQ